MDRPTFRVIIVGGSISGLTLAHCLTRVGISHMVLEKRDEIAPQEGASIGLWPNGSQVLQQLGLYDDLDKFTEPLRKLHVSYPDGFFFSNAFPEKIHRRFGLPIAFLERQKLLQVLYERYPEKSNIILKKKVVEVRPLDHSVCVIAEDGSVYHGDLVVGADGVHSRVRSEMWRLSDMNAPGMITLGERKSMTVEYACVFGISSPVAGLQSGEHINSFLDGLTVLTFHGKDGRVFWFIIRKLDQKFIYPNIPRFSANDAADLCDRLGNVPIWKDICIRHIWRNKEIASMTALEEGIFRTWCFDRIVLLGDSVHKMTPNNGQGANSAIEDAATLASLVNRLICTEGVANPSAPQIDTLLQEYQALRYYRVGRVYKRSRFAVRFQTRNDLFKSLVGRYLLPYASDRLADMVSGLVADGDIIDFLPPPKRIGSGWSQYSTGGHPDLLVSRPLLSLLLLGSFCVMLSTYLIAYSPHLVSCMPTFLNQ
ncbi:flavoprotein monooxygenase [Talaromyces proteolyticus]|uniref:Flavoprotein monooxygenase n=1 Tax=Talaromyces proteolyticus TaxID=1131652 RepID=A0AAD4KH98_9EURO|nr:flavoprotein monooxygenase [Talaromyces proteolyticus]KAH8691172.1 flavoprotein monooxygenase [Talaromyces proteolyticus]